MRRIFAISLILTFLFSTNVLASEYKTSNTKQEEKYLRIGLKSKTQKEFTLKINGEYKINEIKIKDKEELKFLAIGNKVKFKEKNYDVLKIKPLNSNSKIIIKYGQKEHSFSGAFEIKNSRGEILPINIVSVEEYVKGVLPYEMAEYYPLEALKAQAVSARNYAISSINKHKNEGFDVCDKVHCQVYKGIVDVYSKIQTAVNETKGEILKHNGDIVRAFFYASNGGYTESSKNVWNSEYSYLVSKKDEFDTYKWDKSKSYTKSELESMLKKRGYLSKGDKFKSIGKVVTNSSGRNSEIEIIYIASNGSEKVKTLTKEQPRIALSLKSSMFTVSFNEEENKYVFIGKGYGHGVGMSQYGAKNRAKQGHTYKEILNFYYPNTNIEKY